MSAVVTDLDRAHIGGLEKITDGGQGEVFRVKGRSGQLLKTYHAGIPVDGNELRHLIARPAIMTPADRRLLEESAAWPMARVLDGNRCVGFLMPAAPARFTATIGPQRRLLELQYVLYPKKRMWQDLELPSDDERRELARRYVQYFQLLHRYDIVAGDVSMRNFLWTLDGGPGIFALDCDGCRLVGHHPVVPQAQTVDWEDTTMDPGRATVESDRYKLALLVVRLLLADPRITPLQVAQQAALSHRLGPTLATLVARVATPGKPRPHPDEWLRAIDGRPTIALTPPSPRRKPPPPPPAAPERPTIQLRPLSKRTPGT